ncbi:hypothetical protein CES86_5573 [Brucella lupini]|uniref:Uncharacterized protein n=1 Tax=Brucella lupini TaxID=255457 RepID=A0A256GZU1_9HYPH|nr:hypothetical protein CES86_5573 [Brucella lupini]
MQFCTSPKRQLLANDPAVPKERIKGRNYTSLPRRAVEDAPAGPRL